MKLRDLITEEWVDSKKVNDVTYEIFKNPSKKELSKFEYVRWVVDKEEKNIFVWDNKLLHYQVVPKLKREGSISGGAIRDGGKVFQGKIRLAHEYARALKQMGYTDVLERYFDVY